jgi:non-ribosomal peptide synthetase component F
MIEHRSLLDYVHTFTRYFGVSVSDAVIHQASLSFDTAVEEIFPVLCAGGKLVINRESNSDVDALIGTMEREAVTILSTTPAVLYELDRRTERANALRLVISGGDTLKPAAIENLLRRTAVYNTYGPTESTVCATYHRLQSAAEAGLIGKPIPNRQIYITSSDLSLLPAGFTGEICIAGPGLARGYTGRPAVPAPFVDNPFEKGTRLYRTGDLGRWLPDGTLEFTGRKDSQLKVRGYRIEAGEVESVLMQHPSVEDVLVDCRGNGADGNVLLAYYQSPRPLDAPQELRALAKKYLPGYMVPAHFVWLSRFPVTAAGKVDRNALPPPPAPGWQPATGALPANPVESRLADIWRRVLGKDDIGAEDNFFEAGGTSIKASLILALVHKELNVKVALKHLFLHDTIREFAAHVSSLKATGFAQITPIAPAAHYETSYAQQRFWLLDQLDMGNGSNNLNWSYLLEGPLDARALEEAFATLLLRHETLRTSFALVNGSLVQRVHDERAVGFRFNRADLTGCPNWEEEAQSWVHAEANRRFNLETDLLLRAALLLVGPGKYVFVLTTHHIIMDGWSVNVLLGELLALYEANCGGRPNPLPPLAFQYKDYAAWEQRAFAAHLHEAPKAFWRETLRGFAGAVGLPTDFARTYESLNEAGVVNVLIGKSLYDDLQSCCNRHKISVPILLLVALKAYLHKATGRRDLTTGLIVWGRNHVDLDNQIGVFVNSIPVAVALDEDCTYTGLLERVKDVVLQCLEYQMYPYNKIIEDAGLPSGKLFNLAVSANIEENHRLQDLKDVEVREFMPRSAWRQYFDISFALEKTGDGHALSLLYNLGLYQSATVRAIAENVLAALDALVYHPGARILELAALDLRETPFAYWREVFSSYDPDLVFPRKTSLPRGDSAYAVHGAQLDRSFTGATACTQRLGVSYATLFSGLFGLLLMHYNFRKDLIVNLAVPGGADADPQPDAVRPAARIVPLRVSTEVRDTAGAFLRRLEDESRRNLANYCAPAIREVQASANPHHTFDYVVVLNQPAPGAEVTQAPGSARVAGLLGQCGARLGLFIQPAANHWNVAYYYRAEVLTEKHILTFHAILEKLAAWVLNDPDGPLPPESALFSSHDLEELYSLML